MQALLERRRRDDPPARLATLQRRMPSLLLATGLARACSALLLVLSVVMVVERLGFKDPLQRTGVSFVVAAALMSVFTVAVPVYWAVYRREKLLAWSLPLLLLTRACLSPITWPLRAFDPIVRRVSGADLDAHEEQLADRVLDAVERHDDDERVGASQRAMIEAVVELGETDAAAVMTPRTDILGIEATLPLNAVRDAILESGHSRLPVYRDSLDDILGVLYTRDLVGFIGEASPDERFDLPALVREPLLVPSTKPVRDLLNEFRQRRVHMAIVVDEHGGTSGLVTIEDVLEEIVGEIEDEHEPDRREAPSLELLTPTVASVQARMPVGEVNDTLGVQLPEEADYDTLGGFVLATLGEIPVAGDSFDAAGIRVVVESAGRTSIERLRLESADPFRCRTR